MKKIHKRHKKRPALFLLLVVLQSLCLFALCSTPAYAAGNADGSKTVAESISDSDNTLQKRILEEQVGAGGAERIGQELDKYTDEESKALLEGYDPMELINDAAAGKLDLNLRSILNNALKYLFKELYQNLGILIKLAVLIVICALLKNLQSSFLSDGAAEIAFYVCYVVIVSILLVGFSTAVKLGIEIIDGMVGFMYATVPILITMLISGGSITTGGIFQPFMLMMTEVTATIIKSVFIPLIFLSTILTIVNNISEKIQLTRMAGFIKQINLWALGILLTAFIGIVSLQGTLGAVVDGATSKAAKFAISTFIPVIGKTLSDAADTVIGCTLILKNAAGAAVMIGILLICIVPLIKIVALVALYKAAGALFEPISEKRITNCIHDVAGSILHIFSVTAAVAIMFLISITALISAGNLGAMIR